MELDNRPDDKRRECTFNSFEVIVLVTAVCDVP